MNTAEQAIADISFSETAIQHLQNELQQHPEHQALRLSVKKTGCSGYSYVVDYVEVAREGDRVAPLIGSYLVYVDQGSYPFLKGIFVDYVTQGINKKLIFTNPNQRGQCGCGESFTIG